MKEDYPVIQGLFLLYRIRVSKGGFRFFDWQIAQSQVCFVPRASGAVFPIEIRVSKSGSQLNGWQLAQNWDCFCDFVRKLVNLSLAVII